MRSADADPLAVLQARSGKPVKALYITQQPHHNDEDVILLRKSESD